MYLSKTQKLFRYIWRIDAVLILVAAAAAVFAVIALLISEINSSIRHREAVAAAPPVTARTANEDLHLGGLFPVEGTSVFRAILTSERRGIDLSSSGYSGDTRNILFLDFSNGGAKWLLPTRNELITFNTDVHESSQRGESAPPVATVILAKPYSTHPETADGRVLLFDPAARHVIEIATGVHEVDGAAITSGGEIAVLFERSKKYQLAFFDRSSLRKLRENEVNVPQLK